MKSTTFLVTAYYVIIEGGSESENKILTCDHSNRDVFRKRIIKQKANFRQNVLQAKDQRMVDTRYWGDWRALSGSRVQFMILQTILVCGGRNRERHTLSFNKCKISHTKTVGSVFKSAK